MPRGAGHSTSKIKTNFKSTKRVESPKSARKITKTIKKSLKNILTSPSNKKASIVSSKESSESKNDKKKVKKDVSKIVKSRIKNSNNQVDKDSNNKNILLNNKSTITKKILKANLETKDSVAKLNQRGKKRKVIETDIEDRSVDKSISKQPLKKIMNKKVKENDEANISGKSEVMKSSDSKEDGNKIGKRSVRTNQKLDEDDAKEISEKPAKKITRNLQKKNEDDIEKVTKSNPHISEKKADESDTKEIKENFGTRRTRLTQNKSVIKTEETTVKSTQEKSNEEKTNMGRTFSKVSDLKATTLSKNSSDTDEQTLKSSARKTRLTAKASENSDKNVSSLKEAVSTNKEGEDENSNDSAPVSEVSETDIDKVEKACVQVSLRKTRSAFKKVDKEKNNEDSSDSVSMSEKSDSLLVSKQPFDSDNKEEKSFPIKKTAESCSRIVENEDSRDSMSASDTDVSKSKDRKTTQILPRKTRSALKKSDAVIQKNVTIKEMTKSLKEAREDSTDNTVSETLDIDINMKLDDEADNSKCNFAMKDENILKTSENEDSTDRIITSEKPDADVNKPKENKTTRSFNRKTRSSHKKSGVAQEKDLINKENPQLIKQEDTEDQTDSISLSKISNISTKTDSDNNQSIVSSRKTRSAAKKEDFEDHCKEKDETTKESDIGITDQTLGISVVTSAEMKRKTRKTKDVFKETLTINRADIDIVPMEDISEPISDHSKTTSDKIPVRKTRSAAKQSNCEENISPPEKSNIINDSKSILKEENKKYLCSVNIFKEENVMSKESNQELQCKIESSSTGTIKNSSQQLEILSKKENSGSSTSSDLNKESKQNDNRECVVKLEILKGENINIKSDQSLNLGQLSLLKESLNSTRTQEISLQNTSDNAISLEEEKQRETNENICTESKHDLNLLENKDINDKLKQVVEASLQEDISKDTVNIIKKKVQEDDKSILEDVKSDIVVNKSNDEQSLHKPKFAQEQDTCLEANLSCNVMTEKNQKDFIISESKKNVSEESDDSTNVEELNSINCESMIMTEENTSNTTDVSTNSIAKDMGLSVVNPGDIQKDVSNEDQSFSDIPEIVPVGENMDVSLNESSGEEPNSILKCESVNERKTFLSKITEKTNKNVNMDIKDLNTAETELTMNTPIKDSVADNSFGESIQLCKISDNKKEDEVGLSTVSETVSTEGKASIQSASVVREDIKEYNMDEETCTTVTPFSIVKQEESGKINSRAEFSNLEDSLVSSEKVLNDNISVKSIPKQIDEQLLSKKVEQDTSKDCNIKCPSDGVKEKVSNIVDQTYCEKYTLCEGKSANVVISLDTTQSQLQENDIEDMKNTINSNVTPSAVEETNNSNLCVDVQKSKITSEEDSVENKIATSPVVFMDSLGKVSKGKEEHSHSEDLSIDKEKDFSGKESFLNEQNDDDWSLNDFEQDETETTDCTNSYNVDSQILVENPSDFHNKLSEIQNLSSAQSLPKEILVENAQIDKTEQIDEATKTTLTEAENSCEHLKIPEKVGSNFAKSLGGNTIFSNNSREVECSIPQPGQTKNSIDLDSSSEASEAQNFSLTTSSSAEFKNEDFKEKIEKSVTANIDEKLTNTCNTFKSKDKQTDCIKPDIKFPSLNTSVKYDHILTPYYSDTEDTTKTRHLESDEQNFRLTNESQPDKKEMCISKESVENTNMQELPKLSNESGKRTSNTNIFAVEKDSSRNNEESKLNVSNTVSIKNTEVTPMSVNLEETKNQFSLTDKLEIDKTFKSTKSNSSCNIVPLQDTENYTIQRKDSVRPCSKTLQNEIVESTLQHESSELDSKDSTSFDTIFVNELPEQNLLSDAEEKDLKVSVLDEKESFKDEVDSNKTVLEKSSTIGKLELTKVVSDTADRKNSEVLNPEKLINETMEKSTTQNNSQRESKPLSTCFDHNLKNKQKELIDIKESSKKSFLIDEKEVGVLSRETNLDCDEAKDSSTQKKLKLTEKETINDHTKQIGTDSAVCKIDSESIVNFPSPKPNAISIEIEHAISLDSSEKTDSFLTHLQCETTQDVQNPQSQLKSIYSENVSEVSAVATNSSVSEKVNVTTFDEQSQKAGDTDLRNLTVKNTAEILGKRKRTDSDQNISFEINKNLKLEVKDNICQADKLNEINFKEGGQLTKSTFEIENKDTSKATQPVTSEMNERDVKISFLEKNKDSDLVIKKVSVQKKSFEPSEETLKTQIDSESLSKTNSSETMKENELHKTLLVESAVENKNSNKSNALEAGPSSSNKPGPSKSFKTSTKRKNLETETFAEESKRLRPNEPPVREYLDQFVPFLLEGLLKIAYNRPEDPIQYLADWMIFNKEEAYRRIRVAR